MALPAISAASTASQIPSASCGTGRARRTCAGIIVSCIENDRRGDYGLSELGRAQALEAAPACGRSGDTVIFSSDFSRARQTAEIVRAHLEAPEVMLATALRERCFGDWEGSATDNYARVWAADETDPDQAGSGVEPVAAVLDRTTALIVDLERRYSGRAHPAGLPRRPAADPAGGLPAHEPDQAPAGARAPDGRDSPAAPRGSLGRRRGCRCPRTADRTAGADRTAATSRLTVLRRRSVPRELRATV